MPGSSTRDDEPKRNARGQFEKGSTGNKGGRPSGSKNRSDMILQVLSETLDIKLKGRRKKVPASEALFRKLVVDALSGDKSATGLVMREWATAEAKLEGKAEAEYAFSEKDREVIDEIHARMKACEEPNA